MFTCCPHKKLAHQGQTYLVAPDQRGMSFADYLMRVMSRDNSEPAFQEMFQRDVESRIEWKGSASQPLAKSYRQPVQSSCLRAAHEDEELVSDDRLYRVLTAQDQSAVCAANQLLTATPLNRMQMKFAGSVDSECE